MRDNTSNTCNLITAKDLAHINRCTLTQEDEELMVALTLSAKKLIDDSPKENGWFEIQQKIKQSTKEDESIKNTKVVVPFYFKFLAVAASVLCISMSWLTWNNYQLQDQLEQVLTMNRYLEQQLIYVDNGGIIYSQTMQKIGLIESDLHNATSANMKFNLLNQRKELMQNIIKQQGNSNNEYL